MASNPWDFGDSISKGVQTVVQLKTYQQNEELKKQEAIKAKFSTILDGVNSGSKLADALKDNPDAQMHVLNNAVLPGIRLLTGNNNLPDITSMEDPKISAAANSANDLVRRYMAGINDPKSKDAISLKELKMGVAGIMASVKGAADRIQPIDAAITEITPKVLQNAPGPGNTNTTGMVDPMAATITPLTNTLTGQPTMEGPKPKEVNPADAKAKLDSSLRADEKFLQGLIQPAKGKEGLPNVEGSYLGNFLRGGPPKLKSFSKQEQAQLALAQSTVQRLKSNMMQMQALDPNYQIQPEVMDLADKLSKIQGGTPTATATPTDTTTPNMVRVQLGNQVGTVSADKLDQFLKDHKTAKRL